MPLIPEETEGRLTVEEVARLVFRIKEAVERGEAKALEKPPGRRHLHDEMIEISIGLRRRIEAGDKMGALLELADKIINLAVSSPPWSISRLGTEERLKKFAEVVTALMRMNPPLLVGSTAAEHLATFQRFASHAEGIFRDAVLLYQAGRFPRACFLAITCLEEVGKATGSRMAVKAESIYGPLTEKPVVAGSRRDNPFFGHPAKHFLAAAGGVLFNLRLEALLGSEELDRILGTMESGGLVALRERCLYVDLEDGRVVWPEEHIAADVARKWVVVAGEVLAEVLGYPEAEWERLVAAVQEFESAASVTPNCVLSTRCSLGELPIRASIGEAGGV